MPQDSPRVCWYSPWGMTGWWCGAFRGRRKIGLSPQTENSAPPLRALTIRRRCSCNPAKGLNQMGEGGPPNTAFMPSHRTRRSHVGFSFFSRSISWWTRRGGRDWRSAWTEMLEIQTVYRSVGEPRWIHNLQTCRVMNWITPHHPTNVVFRVLNEPHSWNTSIMNL